MAHKGLEITLRNLISLLTYKKKMDLLQVEMFIIYCDVIETITECWTTSCKSKSTLLKEELEENITIILKVLKIDSKSRIPIKISEQQQKDIGNELKRLNTICQFATLLQVDQEIKNDPKVKNYIEATKKVVFTLSVFDEDKAIESLKVLQTTIKTSSVVVSKLDRQMIIKAVGLKAGHWFKCPKGHFYCIGECGGAVQASKCPECGATIGGTGYRLAANNTRATDIF